MWLISDIRNDPALDRALRDLPRNSGFIFRHYHLEAAARRERFDALARVARKCGHCVIVSGDAALARAWGADGLYGPPQRCADAAPLIRLAAVHDDAEIAAANRIGADAALLSPVFPTRSHPDRPVLGPERFHRLAALADMPVIALGGMTQEKAQMLAWPRWAAIDGLVSPTLS